MSRDELVLYLQCLNEVLRGFSIENFERTLKVSKSELEREDSALRELEKATRKSLSVPDIHMRPDVIRITMKELGESEFQTRTGYELLEADKLLKRLTENL